MRFAFLRTIVFLLAAGLLVGCSRDPNVRKQKFYESGMRFFEKGKYPEAAIQFSNATQVDSSFGQAHYQLALTYLKLQQYQRAYQELNAAIPTLADNTQAHIDLANLLILDGHFKEAKEHLDEVATKQPNDPLYHMALANYYAGSKNTAQAVQEMEKAIALDPRRADLYLNLGALQAGEGNPKAAEDNFKKAAALDPKGMNAQLALGGFYQVQGRLLEAEQQFRHAIEVDPKNPTPRNALIRLLSIEGKKTEAEQAARQAKQDLADDPAGYAMLGDYYFEIANDLDRASAEYEALYRDHPKDAKVRKNYIQLLILKNRLDEATKLDDEILKANPQDTEGMLFRGEIKIREGHPDQAVTTLQEVLVRDPDNPVAHYHLGMAFMQVGDQARAETEFREALRLTEARGGRMPEAEQSLADLALRKGDWSALDQSAAKIVAAQPENPNGYALQAIAAVNLKQRDRAEQSIQKAIQVAPQNPIGYIQLGAFRLLENRYADAEKAYQKALELSPGSTDALAGLMKVYLAEKNPDMAIASARAQIAKVPGNSGFYDLLGTALFDTKKDYPGAEAAFQKAIDLDKNNTDAILKLGQVYNAAGSTDRAVTLYQQALNDHPRDVPIYMLLGEFMERRKDWAGAKQVYQKLLEIQPDNAIASNNLAFVMLQEGGNVDVALAMAQTARRERPDSANIADTLGWAYYKKGAFGNAIDLFKEALRKSPNEPSYHYHLGLAYQQSGRKDLAREQFQQVLKMSPNFSEAEDVRRALSELQG